MEHFETPPVQRPGLKVRVNGDGSRRYYWFADKRACHLGYQPQQVRIEGDDRTEEGRTAVAVEADRLNGDMIRWKTENDHGVLFDGTLGALIRRYQTDEESPYRRLKWNTQKQYDVWLKPLYNGAGKRLLASVGLKDINRWYTAARAPKEPFTPERIRTAKGIMTMLRIVIGYGITAEIPHCARINAILEQMRFETPKSRRHTLTYQQAVAVISKAHEMGFPAIALGQALQFDGMIRQSNVTGMWRPLKDKEQANGRASLNGKVWEDGLCWHHISSDLILAFETTKRDHTVEIDLALYPLVRAEIERTPLAQRIGPMIIDERTKRPFSEKEYSKVWRKIARAAGVPDDVWNRDSRSGGITEAGAAGANRDDRAKHAAHSDPNFTAKVYDRGQLEATRRVARLRAAHRNAG